MADQIVTLNATLIIFCCVILSVFLIFLRSQKRIVNRMLAGFLLLLAFDASGWIINSPSFQQSWLNAFRFSSNFLQMPLFLGFIYGSCFTGFKLAPKHILHILPFAAALYFTLAGNQLWAQPLSPGVFQSAFISPAEWRVFDWGLTAQYYLYIAAAVYILWQYRKIFTAHYSNTGSRTYFWLCCLVGSSLFASTFVQLKAFAASSQWQSEFQMLQIFISFFALCVVIWITLSALFMPQLFQAIDRNLLEQTPTKQKPNAQEQKRRNQDIERVSKHMAEEQPFLEPELTLQDLAGRLNMPAHQLSSLLNNAAGESFFNFVNRHRIEFAKTALLNQTKKIHHPNHLRGRI